MANMLSLLRSSIGAFLGWWLGELGALVPRRLRQQGRRERRGPVLIFGRQQSVVLQRTGDDERVLGSVETDAPDHDQRLSQLLKQVKRRRRPVTVRLSDELGLRKVLDLPLAAKDDLDQMLRFEMDRLTPFRADEVYFAHRVLGSDARNRRLSVEVQLAPKRELERALETARSFGIVPPRVELAAGPEGGEHAEPAARRACPGHARESPAPRPRSPRPASRGDRRGDPAATPARDGSEARSGCGCGPGRG